MDGLYLLWWVQEKQMSPALVAATMAAGDLLLMGLEVPTGWFADKFGNRRSLILGSFIQVAGMICCWLADGIPGLVLAPASRRNPTRRDTESRGGAQSQDPVDQLQRKRTVPDRADNAG